MMGWFDFSRLKASSAATTLEIPIFPLKTVFFPGSRLPLKIFEQRYLDMAAACMKDDQAFGICLIESGEEAGAPAQTHAIGTLATIGTWDMPQLGILMITAHGGERFRIEQSRHNGKLIEATVSLLGDPGTVPFPDERNRLLPLLRKVINDLGPERIAEPHRFDDANWVGYRLTEILPIQNLAKQKLLELDDPLSRLEILERYLAQRNLLP
jgi:Lon protease-like protein